jgi:hypothetical protein
MITAHGTLLLVVLAAMALLAFTWPVGGTSPGAAWLETPALCLQMATLLYLASTALVEWSLVKALQCGLDSRRVLGLPTLLGHLWVLLVAAATAWRATASRAYLAGLAWQLAILLTASLLSLVLAVLTVRLAQRYLAESAPSDATALSSFLRFGGWYHACISLLVVFALWYLETRPSAGS